jgi:hypothetical protein
MDRRRFSKTIAAAIALVPFASSPLSLVAQRTLNLDSADDDSYAIWSLLIPVLRPKARSYLVPSKTIWTDMVGGVTAYPPSPMSPIERAKLGFPIEMKVPAEFLDRFGSAAEAFKTQMPRPVLLESKLTLPHPYRLMDTSAMEEYSRLKPPLCVADASHPWHRDRALEKKYASFAAPCAFSRVFFDEDRSLGLVYAGAADDFTVFAFGRQGDRWKQLDWSASTVSFSC